MNLLHFLTYLKRFNILSFSKLVVQFTDIPGQSGWARNVKREIKIKVPHLRLLKVLKRYL